MKPVWKWVLGVLAAIVVIAVLFGIGYLGFAQRAGMMSGYVDGYSPMMGGRGFTHFGGLMFLPMLFAALIPIGVLFGVIYGAVRLAIRDSRPDAACEHCGKPVRVGWKACPHCGKKI